MTSKLDRLKHRLKRCRGLVLAYSGGVDSSLLMAVAAEVLKDRLVCVTAVSPLYPARETALARRLAKQAGVKHRFIRSRELANRGFTANPPARCYHCKKELFMRIRTIANRLGYEAADATNYSDRKDFRPGRQAAIELGIMSPLAQVRLTKAEIRRLARRYRLPNWNKPAMACLASRIPYGTRVTERRLEQIRKAEDLLRRMGISQVRVRHHGVVARIEVEPGDFPALVRHRGRIVGRLRRLGFDHVTMDLAGYETGSLNRLLRR